jgi:hypothetical protein
MAKKKAKPPRKPTKILAEKTAIRETIKRLRKRGATGHG